MAKMDPVLNETVFFEVIIDEHLKESLKSH